ncbi:MAG: T9SS type A sorting domain-containing protein [Saprospiraceae bacterium]
MTLDWSDGATGPIRQNLPAGIYEVTITAPNGATAVETCTVASTINLDATVTPESCPGNADGAIDLALNGAVEPPTAIWNDGFNGFDRTGLSSGTYTVTITSDEGCTFVESYVIATQYDTPGTPSITVENDTLLHAPAGFASYQWLLNGEIIGGATSPDFTATESGEYSVVVANEGGCVATSAAVTVTISATGELLPGFNRLRLMPNPFDKGLHLEWESDTPQMLEVSISDTSGKQLLQQIMEINGTGSADFDTRDWPAGVYFFTANTGGKTWSKKIVRQ